MSLIVTFSLLMVALAPSLALVRIAHKFDHDSRRNFHELVDAAGNNDIYFFNIKYFFYNFCNN